VPRDTPPLAPEKKHYIVTGGIKNYNPFPSTVDGAVIVFDNIVTSVNLKSVRTPFHYLSKCLVENGKVIVRCHQEALGSVLLVMIERGYTVKYTSLIIQDEIFVLVKGLLSTIITYARSGEKDYQRPSLSTDDSVSWREKILDDVINACGDEISKVPHVSCASLSTTKGSLEIGVKWSNGFGKNVFFYPTTYRILEEFLSISSTTVPHGAVRNKPLLEEMETLLDENSLQRERIQETERNEREENMEDPISEELRGVEEIEVPPETNQEEREEGEQDEEQEQANDREEQEEEEEQEQENDPREEEEPRKDKEKGNGGTSDEDGLRERRNNKRKKPQQKRSSGKGTPNKRQKMTNAERLLAEKNRFVRR
tara:strand:- start:2299 stop:3402 length:1104 start_codon:yes stop_codon:yes gene_type:complete